MVLCALLIGVTVSAQHKQHHTVRAKEHNTELSTEQRATIQSKRLTLALGLDQQQQEQIAALLKTRLDERMEWKSRGKSEAGSTQQDEGASRYASLNNRLDRAIAFQENIKGILSDSQFEQWRLLREDKMKERKNRSRDRRRPHPGQG